MATEKRGHEDDRPTAEELEEMIPAERFFSPATFAMLEKVRGRPKAATIKTRVSMRIDPDVLDAFKRQGPGWQTRMNDALREAVRRDAPKPVRARKRA